MENKAREAGVNTKFQYTDKEPTGTCAVIVTEKYRYALIVTEKYRYAVIVTEKYSYFSLSQKNTVNGQTFLET